jgi:hypothetical protein
VWTKPSLDPTSNRVINPPVVIDVDGDEVPDVVFVSSYHGTVAYASQSRLRAVSGRDGSEIWSVTDPALGLNGAFRLAAADIDLDGRPEIVAGADDSRTLVAFDTTERSRRPILVEQLVGGPSIADLDADGHRSIGQQVLSTTDGAGRVPRRAVAVTRRRPIVDLDPTLPAAVVGSTAPGAACSGQIRGNTSAVGGVTVNDGYGGTTDGDPNPEIVLSPGVDLPPEHDGSVKWSTFTSPPSSAWAGPPAGGPDDGALSRGRRSDPFRRLRDGRLGQGRADRRFQQRPARSRSTDGDKAAELVCSDHDEFGSTAGATASSSSAIGPPRARDPSRRSSPTWTVTGRRRSSW